MAASLIKTLIPHTPSIFGASIGHITGYSSTSSYYDLRTTLTLEVLRALMSPSHHPRPIESTQKLMNKPIKVADDTIKVDVSYGNISAEEGKVLEDAIVQAIKHLQKGDVDVSPVGPAEGGLTAEWVGRSTAKGQMELSEEERWKIINQGVKDDRTVL